MDFALALAPIALLVVLLTKPRPWPASRAVPLSAAVAVVIAATWFQRAPSLLAANVLLGLLEALTPITIVWGAVFLFKTMERSGGMDVTRRWLAHVSDRPVAQLMTIGWAFAFLIEGASGFGTPAALAAPLLVGLGFPPVRAAIATLMLNSVPVSFGAVGTPLWFGLGPLGLAEATLLEIGIRTALLHAVAAFVVVPATVGVVLGARAVRQNAVFLVLSTLCCTVPYVLVATVSYEFPALVGGAFGMLGTAALARRGVGLERGSPQAPVGGAPAASVPPPRPGALVRATFPLWATVLVLVVTRVPQLGLRPWLTADAPALEASLGALGELSVSAALVVEITRAFGVDGGDGSWAYRTLYVPALIPFFAVSAVAAWLFRMDRGARGEVARESWARMRAPILALLGALVLVRVLMSGGDAALVRTIGETLAGVVGAGWPWVASYLGALGSFFSGSATISNLTFAGIQASIAGSLAADRTTVLALQSVGAAMGNMVCIHNIVAVCSILGLSAKEGVVLGRTVLPMLLYGLAAVVTARLLYGW